ncbi:hypothetical protein Mapa_004960 [Marchantia paleacea]|nr:hypothetical protein Mapa_004960 [Marchantia paleacea]
MQFDSSVPKSQIAVRKIWESIRLPDIEGRALSSTVKHRTTTSSSSENRSYSNGFSEDVMFVHCDDCYDCSQRTSSSPSTITELLLYTTSCGTVSSGARYGSHGLYSSYCCPSRCHYSFLDSIGCSFHRAFFYPGGRSRCCTSRHSYPYICTCTWPGLSSERWSHGQHLWMENSCSRFRSCSSGCLLRTQHIER